ncbi:uncharacterized protein BYT42DRAFT_265892 [Radiomyces spectabilis]|uniref:uncharacterized protein n=1 Tax=Radiomyces spectabilis TaxID=64574 RepID=UPI00221EA6FB|nr:uncharacterized protein BYT42DRAFT_265892 [Radiomyces spectabilis]KAI8384559.1 hypothetical protein BYT42DRAFT_265892 [Radiomyces spectabilis]
MTGNDAYHDDCFRCVSCKKRIEDLVFTQTSKGIYCTVCHDKRKLEKMRRREAKEKRQIQQQKMAIDASNTQLPSPVSSPTQSWHGSPLSPTNRERNRLSDVLENHQAANHLHPLDNAAITAVPYPSHRSRSSSVDNTTRAIRLNSITQPLPSRSDVISSTHKHATAPVEKPPSKLRSLQPVKNDKRTSFDFALPEIPSLNFSFFDNDSAELANLTKTLGASLALDFNNKSKSTDNKIAKASELLQSSLDDADLEAFPATPASRSPAAATNRSRSNTAVSDLNTANQKIASLEANMSRLKEASKRALDEFSKAKADYAKEVELRQQHEASVSRLRQQLLLTQQARSLTREGFSTQEKQDIEKLAQFHVELQKSCQQLKAYRTTLMQDLEGFVREKQANLASVISPVSHLQEQQKALRAEIKSLIMERDLLKGETQNLDKVREDILNEMVMLNTKNAELSEMNNDLSRRVTEREREAAAVMAGTSFLHSPTSSISSEMASPVSMQRKSSETSITRNIAARDSFNGTQAPKMFKIKKTNVFGKFANKPNKIDSIASMSTDSLVSAGSPVNSRDKRKPSQDLLIHHGSHAFQPTSFLRPVRCDGCGEKMWGLSGYRCQECGYAAHTRCLSHVPQLCYAGTTSTLDLASSPSETDLTRTLFGTDLSAQVAREDRTVPLLVEECIAAVESRGMNYEGIYRKSGGAAQMRAIQLAFEQGDPIQLNNAEEFNDICAVTSVLKQYFRELPNPLITFELYSTFLSAIAETTGQAKLKRFSELLSQLPHANYGTLKLLIQHLHRVQQHSNENLMTTKNLAMVFGPTLLRDKDAARDLVDMCYKNATIEYLITHAFDLFS